MKDEITLNDINEAILAFKEEGISMKAVSDGYHTFGELYKHRAFLTALVLKLLPKEITFKSKLHDDGTMFDDSFVVGIILEEGNITYHYKNNLWHLFETINEIEKAPPFDGHTSNDVLDRLEKLILKK